MKQTTESKDGRKIPKQNVLMPETAQSQCVLCHTGHASLIFAFLLLGWVVFCFCLEEEGGWGWGCFMGLYIYIYIYIYGGRGGGGAPLTRASGFNFPLFFLWFTHLTCQGFPPCFLLIGFVCYLYRLQMHSRALGCQVKSQSVKDSAGIKSTSYIAILKVPLTFPEPARAKKARN